MYVLSAYISYIGMELMELSAAPIDRRGGNTWSTLTIINSNHDTSFI